MMVLKTLNLCMYVLQATKKVMESQQLRIGGGILLFHNMLKIRSKK